MRRLLLIACAACSSPGAKPDAMPVPDAARLSIEITPGSHDFGGYEVDSGAPAPSLLYTVKNVNGSDLDIASVAISGTGANAYTVGDDNTCKGTLADGATCSFTITFLPLTAEGRHASLDVTTSVDVVSASLDGGGTVSGAKILFSPSVQDFGDIEVGGTSEAKTITVLNEAADATFAAAVIDPNGSTFTLLSTDCNAHIPLHGTCTAMVKMSPPYAGSHQATLAITSDGPTGSGGLRGTAQTPFVATPFAAVLGSMLLGQSEPGNTSTFTVTNNGAASTGTLTPTFAGTGASDYLVDSTDCTSLAPLATCSVVVRFAATARGPRLADLVVTDGTSSITSHSSLTASGYTVLITTPPTFASTTVSSTTSKQFTIVNASDHDTGAVSLSITPSGSDYAITGSTGCTSGIAAHTSCTVDVDFTPSATGVRTATLQASASPGGSHSVTLTGTGL